MFHRSFYVYDTINNITNYSKRFYEAPKATLYTCAYDWTLPVSQLLSSWYMSHWWWIMNEAAGASKQLQYRTEHPVSKCIYVSSILHANK